MKSIIYVGIDVHKATFSACAYASNCQQFYSEETFAGNTAKVLEYLQVLRDSCENEVEFHVGYEAGCRGYSLAKDLIAKGIDCVIMAPTTIDKPSDNSKKKTDRLDARLLARALANKTYKGVHIPIDGVSIEEETLMKSLLIIHGMVESITQNSEEQMITTIYASHKQTIMEHIGP